jgi:adenylylsulfate reductase subunit A
MTISQAILWAATNVSPEERPSEIAAAEPYFIGSHSGASGAWVSGPADLAPQEYRWGPDHMSTVEALFCAGDASGASSHKFSSGSHAEGRIVGKSAVRYIVENKPTVSVTASQIDEWREMIFKPFALFQEFSPKTSDKDIHPEYLKPKMFMFRLQKMMDEYAGGVSTGFKTSGTLLTKCLELLAMLKEDSRKLAAADSHELMRCWENIHRMYQAEAHVRSVLFREETRWPGYYFRTDKPKLDNQNWLCFVNCRMNPKTEQWEMLKRPIIRITKD